MPQLSVGAKDLQPAKSPTTCTEDDVVIVQTHYYKKADTELTRRGLYSRSAAQNSFNCQRSSTVIQNAWKSEATRRICPVRPSAYKATRTHSHITSSRLLHLHQIPTRSIFLLTSIQAQCKLYDSVCKLCVRRKTGWRNNAVCQIAEADHLIDFADLLPSCDAMLPSLALVTVDRPRKHSKRDGLDQVKYTLTRSSPSFRVAYGTRFGFATLNFEF